MAGLVRRISRAVVINPSDPIHVGDGRQAGGTGAARAMNLLERCQRDDADAWRELVSRWTDPVYRWAVLLGLGPHEAEDATQEVMETAARRIGTCRAEEAMHSWLYQITRRVVANRRRCGWLRRWLPSRAERETEQDHGMAAFQHEQGQDLARELEVRRCLQRLPPDLVEVLVMIEVVGLTQAEVAPILGIPAGTVASRLRRAREAFLALWNREVEPGVAAPLEEAR